MRFISGFWWYFLSVFNHIPVGPKQLEEKSKFPTAMPLGFNLWAWAWCNISRPPKIHIADLEIVEPVEPMESVEPVRPFEPVEPVKMLEPIGPWSRGSPWSQRSHCGTPSTRGMVCVHANQLAAVLLHIPLRVNKQWFCLMSRGASTSSGNLGALGTLSPIGLVSQ